MKRIGEWIQDSSFISGEFYYNVVFYDSNVYKLYMSCRHFNRKVISKLNHKGLMASDLDGILNFYINDKQREDMFIPVNIEKMENLLFKREL